MKIKNSKEIMQLVFQYQNALTSYAYALIHDWGLAEDAVHEAYLTIMEKWQEYDPEKNIFPWAKKFVYYKCLELLRSRQKYSFCENTDFFDLMENTLSEGFEEKFSDYNKKYTALDKCFKQLKKRFQEMLVAHYWHNLPAKKIAEKEQKTEAAVWKVMSRIREKLHRCMSQHLIYNKEVS